MINTSFWKLVILIRCSLTVTSVGCFRMPSSSLKHTGPTRDTCLVNALMGWVPWWTRPYRTAHALPLKRGKHAQCERHCKTHTPRWAFCAPHYLEYYCINGLVSVYRVTQCDDMTIWHTFTSNRFLIQMFCTFTVVFLSFKKNRYWPYGTRVDIQ